MDSINACGDLKIEWELGKHNNKTFHTAELIVVSPGVPPNIKPLEEAREKNIPIISEIELAAQALQRTADRDHRHQRQDDRHHPDRRDVQGRREARVRRRQYRQAPARLRHRRRQGASTSSPSFRASSSTSPKNSRPALAVFTNLEQDHLDRYGDMAALRRRPRSACSSSAIATASSF